MRSRPLRRAWPLPLHGRLAHRGAPSVRRHEAKPIACTRCCRAGCRCRRRPTPSRGCFASASRRRARRAARRRRRGPTTARARAGDSGWCCGASPRSTTSRMKGGRGMGSAATAASASAPWVAPPRRRPPTALRRRRCRAACYLSRCPQCLRRHAARRRRLGLAARGADEQVGRRDARPAVALGRRFGVDGVDSALDGGGASSSSPPPTARFGWSARERSSPEPAASACSSTDASPKAAVRFAEPHRPAAQKPGGLPSPRAAPRSSGEPDAAVAPQQPLFTQLLPRGGLGLDEAAREARVERLQVMWRGKMVFLN